MAVLGLFFAYIGFFFNIIKFKRSYIYVTSNDMLVIAIMIHNYNNQSHVVIV